MSAFDTTLLVLDLGGVLVFAVSGAQAAARREMDIWGMFVLGLVTAIGGGTLRSVLIADYPIPVLRSPWPFAITLVATLVVFLGHRWIDRISQPIRLFDAIGLGVFTSVGVAVALDKGLEWWAALLMGCVTATVGGILRDLLRREVPLVLVAGELYATAAFGGALAMLTLGALGASRPVAMVCGALVVITLRLGSIYLHWHTRPAS